LLPQAILVVAPFEDQPSEKSIAATTRCRASIRTLNEPLWARCMLRSDFKPRSVTNSTNLGLLGCCHLAIDLSMDQPIIRSHPNKAVDDVEAP